MLTGRSETELEYDVGFDSDGRISALSVRGWFLAGADLDLAWNDMFIIQTGADQVCLPQPLTVYQEALLWLGTHCPCIILKRSV